MNAASEPEVVFQVTVPVVADIVVGVYELNVMLDGPSSGSVVIFLNFGLLNMPGIVYDPQVLGQVSMDVNVHSGWPGHHVEVVTPEAMAMDMS